MQDTELRKNGCYFSVAIRASGKASHWNIALKRLMEEKEYDGDVSNACEKADQKLIKLKMLVEHGRERQYFFQLRVENERCGQAARQGTRGVLRKCIGATVFC